MKHYKIIGSAFILSTMVLVSLPSAARIWLLTDLWESIESAEEYDDEHKEWNDLTKQRIKSDRAAKKQRAFDERAKVNGSKEWYKKTNATAERLDCYVKRTTSRKGCFKKIEQQGVRERKKAAQEVEWRKRLKELDRTHSGMISCTKETCGER